MFSSAVEVVLTIAYREAVSRRHAYVTLEHLLYALAHDNDGERILAACGAESQSTLGDEGQLWPGTRGGHGSQPDVAGRWPRAIFRRRAR